MRLLLIGMISFLSSFALNAQDLPILDSFPSAKNFIKIYKNFRYESLPDLVFDGADFNYFVERQDFFYSGFGVGFSHFRENGHFWEIGLAEIMFSSKNKATTFIEVDTLLYQDFQEVSYNRKDFFGQLVYGITLGESDNSSWRMTAAAALLPFFQSIDVDAADESSLPVSANLIGGTLALYPAFQFRIFKKGYLEISVPIRLLRAAAFTGDSGNPFLNLKERQQTTSDIDFAPSVYEFRLGLAIGL